MKNFTLLAFVFLLFSSCVKEDLTPLVIESEDGITRLYVKVSFYDSSLDHGCGEGEVVPVTDGEAFLYVKSNETADGKFSIMQGQTDAAGLIKFENLEGSDYELEVISPYGTKEQNVFAVSGKTTRIQVRF